VQRGVDQPNIVGTNDLYKLFSSACEFLWEALAALEPDFDSIVIFVELDLGLTKVGGLLNFLEEMLTM